MRLGSSVLALATAAFLLTSASSARSQEIPQPLFGNCCSCKAQVKFLSGLDLLKVGARIIPTPTAVIDPVVTGMTVVLSNLNGTILSVAVPPGGFVEKMGGRKFVYKDKAAKASGGIFTATLQERSDSVGGYIVSVKAYGDLSAATLADMTTQIVIGTSPFFDNSTWEQTSRGWKQSFPQL